MSPYKHGNNGSSSENLMRHISTGYINQLQLLYTKLKTQYKEFDKMKEYI
jgi:hypothetical protein